MKRQTIICLLIFLTPFLTAQVKNLSDRQYFMKFDWEVSSLVAIGIEKATYKSTSEYFYNGNRDDEFYSEISLAIGFFILDGLSIEPELDYNFFPNDASFSLIGNISYTISIPRKNIYPFFKLGYGKSGFGSYDNGYYTGNSEGLFGSLDAKVINASAGLKIIQSSPMAMKLELNYKYITVHQDITTDYWEPYSTDNSLSALSLKFGISFLF
jgi:hypothetical protein